MDYAIGYNAFIQINFSIHPGEQYKPALVVVTNSAGLLFVA